MEVAKTPFFSRWHLASLGFILSIMLSSWIPFAQAYEAGGLEFPTNEQAKEFRDMVGKFRCPVCQNETLLDSRASVATDIKTRIHKQMLAGKSESQIKDYLVQRYGYFILYDPPMTKATWPLWFGGIGLLLVGIFVVFLTVRKSAQRTQAELSPTEHQKLATLLEDSKEHKAP